MGIYPGKLEEITIDGYWDTNADISKLIPPIQWRDVVLFPVQTTILNIHLYPYYYCGCANITTETTQKIDTIEVDADIKFSSPPQKTYASWWRWLGWYLIGKPYCFVQRLFYKPEEDG